MVTLSTLPWKKMESDIATKSDEKFVTAFSTHWVKYVFPVFAYCIGFILIIGGFYICAQLALIAQKAAWVLFLFLFACMAAVHHWFFHRVLSEGMIDIIITNKRLIFLQDILWFRDDLHEVDLERIRAVEAHKEGFAQNLLQYGYLWFDTGGSDLKGGRIIDLVPHPHRKAKMIEEILQLKS